MRRVMMGDAIAAALVLRAVPEGARAACFAAMLARAHAADLWRKRLGRVHPEWGNGSLMALAMAEGAGRVGEPSLADPSYLAALAVLIEALGVRAGRAEEARRRRGRRAQGAVAGRRL
jgi:hypothetical protein